MPRATQPPESDLILPLPGDGEVWDPHTIHTHYFGFAVPEAALGVFFYLRCMPAFGSCQGGVVVYQGLDNLALTDTAYSDYQMTMPWPAVDGTRIAAANGLAIEFVGPGRHARLTYASRELTLDVDAVAVTPLTVRGHLVPGEELRLHETSGGSEQFLRYTGELVLRGERHAVDCVFPRDRSWRQVRTEDRDAHDRPPLAWTPIAFGDDLAFNQIGIESVDTDPAWRGLYDVAADAPTHHFAWVSRDGELRDIARVRRSVTRTHPQLHAPTAMAIEATDEAGDTYAFTGEAIALTPLPMWPNVSAFDSIFRWTDDRGRVAHGTAQTMHTQAYAHHVRATA